MSKAITSVKLVLGSAVNPCRFSFLVLDKARPFNDDPNGTPKFQGTGLLDPSNAEHARQILAVKEAAKKLLQEGGIDKDDLKSVCFGDGSKKKYDGYKDRFFLQAANEIRPGTANRGANPVAPGDKQFPYSGAFGIMKVTLWLQNNKWGKRINANLLALQYVRDGEAFGQRPVDVQEEFEALGDDEGYVAHASGGGQIDDPF